MIGNGVAICAQIKLFAVTNIPGLLAKESNK